MRLGHFNKIWGNVGTIESVTTFEFSWLQVFKWTQLELTKLWVLKVTRIWKFLAQCRTLLPKLRTFKDNVAQQPQIKDIYLGRKVHCRHHDCKAIERVVKSTLIAEAFIVEKCRIIQYTFHEELFREVLDCEMKLACFSDSDNLVKDTTRGWRGIRRRNSRKLPH